MIKGGEHFDEEYLDRIDNRSYKAASPPASSKVSS
jgi:hypothetical protein